MIEKQLVGEKAAEHIKDGMVVGLGTGSTFFYTLQKLGQLVKEGLSFRGIPTSVRTQVLAKEMGIPLVDFSEIDRIDLAIDGADEVNPDLDLIKGGGGALLREKIIAKAAKTFVVIADPNKAVEKLGGFRLPVEVVPFGYQLTKQLISKTGIGPELRMANNEPYVTDNGNYLFDCSIGSTHNIKELEQKLNMIPGVVENGLFIGIADILITTDYEQNVVIKNRKES
ncbi:ribose-5-phosphate isomerase RpiA [Bacillus gobiensis]|uniref:ribose-5-phosphate isomerase RpiA n=1 Tax=Bacillus gobiensis TaxID=1441095 RepID=UPI003D252DE0